ncbi:MAG: ScyD/ScyE family protein [Chloroflexi bacterium]|nr:ScyD/ScyE family protein [Chloroflexota bacterium]
MLRLKIVAIGAALGVLLTGVVGAQSGPSASGLLSPRHIAYDASGTLWIAEAGAGGDVATDGPLGPALAGLTGQVSTLGTDGTQAVYASNLPSMNWGFDEIVGVHAAVPVDDLLYLVVGNGGGDATGSLGRGLVLWDMESESIAVSLDTLAAESALNPDGEIIDSNPMDIAFAPDGTIYLADAGANTVWRVVPGVAELQVFAAWTDNPVPTSVEVDSEGSVYVGFLSGFPHVEGSARVEKWSSSGTLVETISGLTAVVDLAMDSTGLYAVEYGRYGDNGFIPATGQVVRVDPAGTQPVATGLNYPFGLALSPSGVWMVSFDTSFANAPGNGRVGSLEDAAAAGAQVPQIAPTATEEVVPAATAEVSG